MLRNIPTEYLRSLIAIAELGSFTMAGDRLAKSQSSISLQIKKLEEIVGKQIFVRQGHNFTLTQSGETLLVYARQILQLNDKAIGELSGNEIMGKIRLGIPSEFAYRLLPKIIGGFSRQNPQIALEVVCDLSRNLKKDLHDQKYDLVLLTLDVHSEAKSDYIIEDELVWVCAAQDYADVQSPVSLVVAPEGCIYRKRAIEHLERANIPWRVTYTIMDIAGITTAVEEGLGLTVLAKKTIPTTLKEIAPPMGSDLLGFIGLALLHADENNISEASNFLADYIKSQL